MMKKILVSATVILFFLSHMAQSGSDTFKKARGLMKEKRYAQALALIETGLKESGLSFALARLKLEALKKLNRLDEADRFLADALGNPSLSRYHRSIAFAKSKLNAERKNFVQALKDLDRLADLDFNDYGFFNQDKYKPLKNLKGFNRIVEKMKRNGGIGKPAKDFKVTLLGGDEFILSQHRGKVVLVDFWSTHCDPCLAELPQMKKYYAEFHPEGLVIIGISLDHQRDRLDSYLKQLKLPWGVSFDPAGWNRKTVPLYNIFSIPSYWLVDRKGILRYFGLRKEELKSAIKKLIGER